MLFHWWIKLQKTKTQITCEKGQIYHLQVNFTFYLVQITREYMYASFGLLSSSKFHDSVFCSARFIENTGCKVHYEYYLQSYIQLTVSKKKKKKSKKRLREEDKSLRILLFLSHQRYNRKALMIASHGNFLDCLKGWPTNMWKKIFGVVRLG